MLALRSSSRPPSVSVRSLLSVAITSSSTTRIGKLSSNLQTEQINQFVVFICRSRLKSCQL